MDFAGVNKSSDLIKLDSLFSVLTQCFGIMLLGYITGRSRVINEANSKSLNIFVTYISLPSLVFLQIAQTNLSSIDWTFIGCIFLSKLLVFFFVALITLLTTHPASYGKAGLYGIFCTQSNDFAIGYPLLHSLFDNIDYRLANYAYVLAPLQLVIINPIGFLMMEIETVFSSKKHKSSVYLNVVKRIITNPIILMTLLGIAWNLLFGSQVNSLLASFLKVLSDAFFATAIFMLGLFMVGKFDSLTSSSRLIIPCTLTGVKLFILPLLARTLIELTWKGSINSSIMSGFGFIYSIIPTAPTLFIFALQYGISTWIVSTSLVICTLISSPLIIISSYMIRLSSSAIEYDQEINSSIKVVSEIAIFCAIFTVFLFILNKKLLNVTHQCSLFIIFSQLLVSLSGYFKTSSFTSSFQNFSYLLYFYGCLSSHVWTFILASVLSSLCCKTLNYTLKFTHLIMLLAFFNVISVVFITLFSSDIINALTKLPTKSSYLDYFFLTLIIISITIIIITLIIQARNQATGIRYCLVKTADSESNLEEPVFSDSCGASSSQSLINDDKDLNVEGIFDSNLRLNCSGSKEYSVRQKKQSFQSLSLHQNTLERTDDQILESADSESRLKKLQVPSHTLLLLLILLSLLINLSVSIGKMVSEKPTGIFIELEFLNVLLIYSQAIGSFIIFGLDGSYFMRICNLLKYLLPACCISWFNEPLSNQELLTHEFKELYLARCEQEIKYSTLPKSNQKGTFKGSDLIKWLIENHVVADERSGISYATSLLTSNVISYQTKYLQFNDSCLYQVTDSNLRQSIKLNAL